MSEQLHNFEVIISYKCRKVTEVNETFFEERMILTDTCLANVERRCKSMFGENTKVDKYTYKWDIICLD